MSDRDLGLCFVIGIVVLIGLLDFYMWRRM